MRISDVADGTAGRGRAAEAVGPGAASGLPVLPWRSANQPHVDTFKCQRIATGIRLSSNTLAACRCTFHHHVRSQLCLKEISRIKKETFTGLILLLTKDLMLQNTNSFMLLLL